MSINPRKLHQRTIQRQLQKAKGVYIIQFQTGIKIGRTENFKNRLEKYIEPWNQEIQEIWFLHTANHTLIEQKLKRQFSGKNIRGEYFPLELKQKLINTLNNLARHRDGGKKLCTVDNWGESIKIYDKCQERNFLIMK